MLNKFWDQKQNNTLILSFKFDCDQENLILGNNFGQIKFHDQETKIAVKNICSDYCLVAFSPSSRLLASYGRDYVLRIWDVKLGKLFKNLITKIEKVALYMAFSFDDQIVACSLGFSCSINFSHIQLWDLKTDKGKVYNFQNPIYHHAFSPIEQVLAISIGDSINFMDISKKNEYKLVVKEEQMKIHYSPCGKLLASCGLEGKIYNREAFICARFSKQII